MREPQEIEDEEHEQVLERVAAVDVAKASGMVCMRVPHPCRAGKRLSRVWEVGATTGAIIGLGEQLLAQGIERVVAPASHTLLRRLPALQGCGTRMHTMPDALATSTAATRSKTCSCSSSSISCGSRIAGPSP